MPTIFYWLLCIVILLVADAFLGKRERTRKENESPKEKKVRTIKGVILAATMIGLACAISYFVRK